MIEGKEGKEDLKVDKDGEVSQNQMAKVAWAMVRNLEFFSTGSGSH